MLKKIIALMLSFLLVLLIVSYDPSYRVESAGSDFEYITQLTPSGQPDIITITGYTGNDAHVVIPATIGRTIPAPVVTHIGNDEFYPFSYNDNIESVVIPDTVRTIGRSAFSNSRNLKHVELGDGLEYIGQNAFSGCDLQSIDLPEGLKEIIYGAFRGNASLEEINIPRSVNNIGEMVFRYCRGLKEINVHPSNNHYKDIDGVLFTKDGTVLKQFPLGKEGTYTVPSSVNEIEFYAFSASENLTEVIIPENVTEVGRSLFYQSRGLIHVEFLANVQVLPESTFESCKSLQTVVMGNSIRTISEYAFGSCESLVSVQMSNNLEIIEKRAFRECENLHTVDLPDSVKFIGERAFYENKGLTVLNLGNSVEVIEGDAFYDCESLREVVIPVSVTTLGSGVFRNCTQLETVVIEGGLERIPRSAFRNSQAITSIIIPESVKEIDRYAFSNNSNMQKALFEGEPPDVFYENVFENTSENFVIEYYEGTQGWTNPWYGYTTVAIARQVTSEPEQTPVVEITTPSDETLDFESQVASETEITVSPDERTQDDKTIIESESSFKLRTPGGKPDKSEPYSREDSQEGGLKAWHLLFILAGFLIAAAIAGVVIYIFWKKKRDES